MILELLCYNPLGIMTVENCSLSKDNYSLLGRFDPESRHSN